MERRVYDLVSRRFIAVFYPDCKISTTTVLGNVDDILFRVNGKQIIDPGWRVIFAKVPTNVPNPEEKDEDADDDMDGVLPAFAKGETGPHVPDLNEKWTQPPRPFTEATLLRAMETAGKLVDNDELRDAMKENGIGRPSTRAAIIETLFKRQYVRKGRKNRVATATGVELIELIHEELLKSAELTGIWEKKLREIERKTYEARQFLEELKQMVNQVVYSVLSDNTNRRITIMEAEKETAKGAKGDKDATPKKRTRKAATGEKKKSTKKNTTEGEAPTTVVTTAATDEMVGKLCPLCGKGTIIKGNTAYGCSEWKNGCTYRLQFIGL